MAGRPRRRPPTNPRGSCRWSGRRRPSSSSRSTGCPPRWPCWSRTWSGPGRKSPPPSTLMIASCAVEAGVATLRKPMNCTVCPPNDVSWPGASRTCPRCPKEVAAASPTAMTTTPMCTTMPPLARPTNPRHPARVARPGVAPAARAERQASRTDRTRARPADAAANAPRPKATSGSSPWTPPRTQATTVTTASAAGMAMRPRITDSVVFRHGNAGATPIKNNRARPTGTARVLKYGAPTVTCWPSRAW